MENLICHVINLAHLSSAYVLQAKATSNTSPDIELGERECCSSFYTYYSLCFALLVSYMHSFSVMAEKCKNFGNSVVALLKSVRDESLGHVVKDIAETTLGRINELASLIDRLTGQIKGDSEEIIGDMVETELANMDKAIEDAANRIAVSIISS